LFIPYHFKEKLNKNYNVGGTEVFCSNKKKKLSTGFVLIIIFCVKCFNRPTAGTQKDTLLEWRSSRYKSWRR